MIETKEFCRRDRCLIVLWLKLCPRTDNILPEEVFSNTCFAGLPSHTPSSVPEMFHHICIYHQICIYIYIYKIFHIIIKYNMDVCCFLRLQWYIVNYLLWHIRSFEWYENIWFLYVSWGLTVMDRQSSKWEIEKPLYFNEPRELLPSNPPWYCGAKVNFF